MSKVTVDNLRKSSEGADRDISGVAAAWARWDMTGTPSFTGSLNMSSITDNGVGDQTPTVTSAFAAADFSAGGLNGLDNTLDEGITASTINVITRTNAGIKTDSSRASTQLFGDLA